MIAMRRLAKVLVSRLLANKSAAHIARPCPAGTRHFVTSILLDKLFVTAWFGTRSNLGIGNGFFHLETALGFVFLFDFRALEWNMGWFLTELARFLATRRIGTLENHLRGWNLCLNAACWT